MSRSSSSGQQRHREPRLIIDAGSRSYLPLSLALVSFGLIIGVVLAPLL
jgi:hypothetical protein